MRLVVENTYSAYWTAWQVEVKGSGDGTARVRYVMRSPEWVDRPQAEVKTQVFEGVISMETASLIREAYDTVMKATSAGTAAGSIRIFRSGMVYSQFKTRPEVHPELAPQLAELAEVLRELCSSSSVEEAIEERLKRTARRLRDTVHVLGPAAAETP